MTTEEKLAVAMEWLRDIASMPRGAAEETAATVAADTLTLLGEKWDYDMRHDVYRKREVETCAD